MAENCEARELIIKALENREILERIPSFVQSVMTRLAFEYFEKFDTDEHPLEEENILITPVRDFTIYKCLGYDSHWAGGPDTHLKADDTLKEKIAEMEKEVKKRDPAYRITDTGRIIKGNEITNWYVGPSIKDEATLKLFIDHLELVEPTTEDIEKWRLTRLMCFDKNFCPFISVNMVMEGGLGASMALVSKLMRKNPSLLEEWYDRIMEPAIARFKAGIKAGYKLFCTADDMAYKTGPMMSPRNYRKFVMPRARILCNMVRDAGGVIFMHTDGNIYDVIDIFIEAGYHAIQPLEPTSGMSIARVKERWGDRIAVIGNCDTTSLLPFGTEKEIRAAVRQCMREGGRKGYMFAASGSLHNRIPLENILVMLDEWKKINGLIAEGKFP